MNLNQQFFIESFPKFIKQKGVSELVNNLYPELIKK